MPKYLIQASYTADGVQGLLKDGGLKRRAAAEQAIKGLGGRLEAFYFAFGDTDVFAIADAPDNQRQLLCPSQWPRAVPCERRPPCL